MPLEPMAESTSSPGGVYIRAASPADAFALSRICLLTGDAGASAEHKYDFGELPGLIWAEPYVHMPACYGFVMVDPAHADAVVGYLLGAYDTRAFERAADLAWFPSARAKFPYPPAHPDDPSKPAKDADAKLIEYLHAPPYASDVAIAFSPAHLHIDILPEYQRQGWGRRLIARAVQYLRDERGLDRLWLGMDIHNAAAGRFYERLGFTALEGAQPGMMQLYFENFEGQ
ncbi:acyl-CoA N-acyltransferase [Amylocystis lapponica]|nr:acyl-CoA N-acyltransferase [Amylocystis lapponica]